jgi:SAM-dependent methyltransferase
VNPPAKQPDDHGDKRTTMSSAIAQATNYVSWILDRFRPFVGRTVLEIGTGYGTYRPQIRGVDYTSIDIDPVAVAKALEQDPTGNYLVADIASPTILDNLGVGKFDTIICSNVLEHVENDSAALDNIHKLLAPGGHLLLFVPAHPALYGDMDRLAGHCRRYTRSGLCTLAQQAGFRRVEAIYFNPLGGLGWWVNTFRRYTDLNSPAINSQILIFDRWLIPVSRAINPLFQNFFGQSVLGVFRR